MRRLIVALAAVLVLPPAMAQANDELCSDLVIIQAQKDNADFFQKCLFVSSPTVPVRQAERTPGPSWAIVAVVSDAPPPPPLPRPHPQK